MSEVNNLTDEAVTLLKQLISIPSFSRQEDKTADAIGLYLQSKNITFKRFKNNIWAVNKHYDASKPTLLLNSHHDTVQPNKGYTVDPFLPQVIDGKLYGLGSNDAGGCLVSLMATFLSVQHRNDLNYNLVFAATAEEEISGTDGVEALLLQPDFKDILGDSPCAIVGEPTGMQMAVAEKGLIVIDCIATGVAGHAAREEGVNAIYKALKDMEWFRNYKFDKVSPLLGPVKMSVTSIETSNKAHNVIPGECRFVVDIRINELYDFEEVLSIIHKNIDSIAVPRSLRLRSSTIAEDHPLVHAGLSSGRKTYGSPTTSDKALMPFPALKMGPGDSERSHSADEFIYINQIQSGIKTYMDMLNTLL